MTDERILEIADSCDHDLLAFARAITAEQQEEDAKVCERLTHSNQDHCAAAIRKGGEG